MCNVSIIINTTLLPKKPKILVYHFWGGDRGNNFLEVNFTCCRLGALKHLYQITNSFVGGKCCPELKHRGIIYREKEGKQTTQKQKKPGV